VGGETSLPLLWRELSGHDSWPRVTGLPGDAPCASLEAKTLLGRMGVAKDSIHSAELVHKHILAERYVQQAKPYVLGPMLQHSRVHRAD
jgi:hypothetical protein